MGMVTLKEDAERLVSASGNPILKRSLAQIHQASLQFKTRVAQEKTPVEDVKLLEDLGVDAERDIIEGLNIKKSLSQPAQSLEPTDIEGFTRNQYENAIIVAIEDAKNQTSMALEQSSRYKMEKEWEETKKEMFKELGYRTIGWNSTNNAQPQLSAASIPKIEAYRTVIETLVRKRIQEQNLAEAFSEAFDRMRSSDPHRAEIKDCWKMLRMFLDSFDGPQRNIFEDDMDSPESIRKTLRKRAKAFLERQYYSVIERRVGKSRSRSGGRELEIIESYAALRQEELGRPTRGRTDKWAVIYYCVRCGRLSDAIAYASHLPGEENFVKILRALQSEQADASLVKAVKEDYQNRVNQRGDTDLDPALQALYVALGRVKIDARHFRTIISTTQDFLWLKLASIKDDDPPESEYSLASLQKDLKKWGPKHFNPKGTNPLLYFQVLLLCQEFKEAISYLDSFPPYRIESIHFGVSLYYYGLLSGEDYSTGVGFSFEKMLQQYVRQFGGRDPAKFVYYFFLIHDEDEKIETIVSYILDTRQIDLLGGNQPDGSQKPSVMDLLPQELAVEIISRVAESFTTENFDEAVRLYDLAGRYDRVLEIVNHRLGLVLTKPSKERTRISETAETVYHFYSKGGNASILNSYELKEQVRAFKKMQQLLRFFEKYQSEPPQLPEALNILTNLNIIPLRAEDLQVKVQEFNNLEDCVKRNFSDILLAAMKILHSLYGERSMAEQQRSIESAARTLVTYSGMIPYQMPGNDNQEFINTSMKIF